jgi:hypothetical protein
MENSFESQPSIFVVDDEHFAVPVRCPSRNGSPTRIMSVRDQLISLAADNAYHLGRIVLHRQLLHAWRPASGWLYLVEARRANVASSVLPPKYFFSAL